VYTSVSLGRALSLVMFLRIVAEMTTGCKRIWPVYATIILKSCKRRSRFRSQINFIQLIHYERRSIMTRNNYHHKYNLNLTSRKKTLVLMALSLLLTAVVLSIIILNQANINEVKSVRTVQMSTTHPVYRSVESMINAKETSLVAEAVVMDNGTVRSVRDVADENVPPDVHTDYVIELTRVIKGDARVKSATIALMGGAVNGTNYVLEGVPTLKKGDHILVFASRGRDGKYYPLSGGTAIAKYSGRGQYSLTRETIAGNGDNDRSFTADSLESMVK